MSSTLTNLTAATTWSGTDLFYALVGGNSRKIAAAKFLVAETSSSLSMQDSTTDQTFRIYRTFTDSSNYERLAFSSGGGTFNITAETAGTGTDNISLVLTTTGTGTINLTTGGGIISDVTTTSTASTSTTVDYRLATTGTAAANFGQSIIYGFENASGTHKNACVNDIYWTDATNGSEDAAFKVWLLKAGTTTAVMLLDTSTTATHTSLQILDAGGFLQRVTTGANDSGGSGFRMLRINN